MIYRTYSYIDLLDLLHIESAIEAQEDFKIEIDTILATYFGHTIFSLFVRNLKVYRKILKKLTDQFGDD